MSQDNNSAKNNNQGQDDARPRPEDHARENDDRVAEGDAG